MSSMETKNKSRLYLSALLLLAATAVLSTVTPTGNNVFAQDDSEEDSNGNSGNVEDNGNDDNPGGMGNCDSGDDCETQPDRVGNDEDDTDADRDGPGGADESPGTEEDDGDANCWGKVSSELGKIQDHPAHAADPVGGDTDNETPREGVGNQAEGHPSDHADTVGGFLGIDEPCVD